MKKLSINYLSAYLLSAFFLILELFFFTQDFLMLFIVLELRRLYFVILLNMDFLFPHFFCFV